MFGFLLQQRHFGYLKCYLDFLVLLPPFLDKMKSISGVWVQQGHALVTPPDTDKLVILSSFSTNYLRALTERLQELDRKCDSVIADLNVLAEELRLAIENTPGDGLRLPINSLDHRRFTLFSSEEFIGMPPTDVDGLLHELALRLMYLGADVGEVKDLVRELNLDIHNIFANFIQVLSLDMCRCHGGRSKLEVYHASGEVMLPGMRGVAPKEQVYELEKIYRRASSAINNINDFFFGLRYFCDTASRELIGRKKNMKLSESPLKLKNIGLYVAEIDALSEQIKIWSRE